jgi:hypothetical protein
MSVEIVFENPVQFKQDLARALSVEVRRRTRMVKRVYTELGIDNRAIAGIHYLSQRKDREQTKAIKTDRILNSLLRLTSVEITVGKEPTVAYQTTDARFKHSLFVLLRECYKKTGKTAPQLAYRWGLTVSAIRRVVAARDEKITKKDHVGLTTLLTVVAAQCPTRFVITSTEPLKCE